MHLNWFAPLPPRSSAAARLSAQLLPLLSRQVDVTLWAAQPDWERSLLEWAPVRDFQDGTLNWADLNRADVTIYHLDGSPETDSAIRAIADRHAGVVVLHQPAVVPEGALGIVVSSPAAFEEYKRRKRWPVVQADPDSPERWVETVVRFLADTPRFHVMRTRLQLVSRTASEWRQWLGTTTTPSSLTPVLQGIHDLLGPQ